ncbi:MAG: hypothetical protein AAFW64_07815, partial [Pseudomonadota bacterium]
MKIKMQASRGKPLLFPLEKQWGGQNRYHSNSRPKKRLPFLFTGRRLSSMALGLNCPPEQAVTRENTIAASTGRIQRPSCNWCQWANHCTFLSHNHHFINLKGAGRGCPRAGVAACTVSGYGATDPIPRRK